jgi:hypothetical protein
MPHTSRAFSPSASADSGADETSIISAVSKAAKRRRQSPDFCENPFSPGHIALFHFWSHEKMTRSYLIPSY